MKLKTSPILWLYGLVITGLSLLYYGVLTPFEDARLSWFRARLKPQLPAPPTTRPRIWIHAVALGEAKVTEALHAVLRARRPDLSVVLSSTTPGGAERVRRDVGADNAFIMPLDTMAAQRRIFDTVQPDLLVLVESEFWPAQFIAAGEAKVPVVVVNAILSEKSYAGHRRYPALSRATVLRAARVYAQDEVIAGRFRALGLGGDKVAVCGNLKLAPPPGHVAVPDRSGPRTLTFGNLHVDEIDMLRPAVERLRADHPELRVLLVPRYPSEMAAASARQGFGPQLALIEEMTELDAAGPLVWINRMGILTASYLKSEIAVVCGTFGAVGGHDLVEPLHFGAESIYGPNVVRQRPLHQALRTAGLGRQVQSPAELSEVLEQTLAAGPSAGSVRKFALLSRAAQTELEAIADDLLRRLAP